MLSEIGVGELVVGVYKARIKPQNVPKLDRRVSILSLLHIFLTGDEVSYLGFL
jgi:hypothetical protein